ncbi:MAG: hypothetical protein WA183_05350 [Chthoniobacterales bacterium]
MGKQVLCILEHVTETQEAERTLSSEESKAVTNYLQPRMADACARVDLIVTIKHINHLCRRLEDGITFQEVRELLRALNREIRYEMCSELFLHVPAKDSEYYMQPEPLFFDGFRDTFPSAISDVQEAGKCLALERPTACIFHLMRIMEAGLKALARKMNIPYAPSWEGYLRQIKEKLEIDWKDKAPEWKAEEEFYRESAAHLSAVKIAWRNPTMHIVKTYSYDESKEVFGAVRGLMRHLATKLKEPELNN